MKSISNWFKPKPEPPNIYKDLNDEETQIVEFYDTDYYPSFTANNGTTPMVIDVRNNEKTLNEMIQSYNPDSLDAFKKKVNKVTIMTNTSKYDILLTTINNIITRNKKNTIENSNYQELLTTIHNINARNKNADEQSYYQELLTAIHNINKRDKEKNTTSDYQFLLNAIHNINARNKNINENSIYQFLLTAIDNIDKRNLDALNACNNHNTNKGGKSKRRNKKRCQTRRKSARKYKK